MCGIVGTLNLSKFHPILEEDLRQMLAMIRHRGPDQFGIYIDEQIGMGNARLSILDLECGQQPICNEDGSLWIVYNGEIFNYLELRPELEARGHRFETNTDTEVLLHLYEQYGPECLARLNGQFAFAIWDANENSLFMARDRLGIRPLFYTIVEGALIFASEIKAILCDPRVRAEIDPLTLEQIFTYWSPLSPRTAFKDIQELPPGHYLLTEGREVVVERYWQVDFPGYQESDDHREFPSAANLTELMGEFRELLIDAARLRLRADVPVGAYLSGGLDSSTIAAIIRNYSDSRLDTFSITFEDPSFDEREYQNRMADHLGTDHHIVHATNADIGEVFPDVVWHAETPLLRTSPAPMFLLSKLVNSFDYKVVLTGEGADEFLLGYNIFKEAKVRNFWARQPDSQFRPLLLKRLYPYISDLADSGGDYLRAFFGHELTRIERDDYSHMIRWRNTSRAKRFFSSDLQDAINSELESIHSIPYPANYCRWDPLQKAQYLEISIFLSEYLLSSQGDRMAMAHSVEGRFPFLDYRVVEFCNRMPSQYKLRGLNEKYFLKKLAQEWVPPEIWDRPKKPYRAPIRNSFFGGHAPAYVGDLLSEESIAQSGLFNPKAVSQLVRKVESGNPIGETDNMAIVGIISSLLVFNQFVKDFRSCPPLSAQDDVKIFRNIPHYRNHPLRIQHQLGD